MSGPKRPLAMLKAMAALVATGFFMAGIPMLLVQLVGNPLPTVVPSWADFSHAITTGDIASWTWIKIVACVVWVAWAQLAASFIVEIFAALRGGTAAAIRGLGATQWLAARVIGHVTLVTSFTLQSTAGIAGAVAPLPMAPMADSLANSSGSSTLTLGTLVQTETDAGLSLVMDSEDSQPGAAVDVERRDTLWSLAERHLGDGERWEEIRDANVGRTMDDGARLAHDFSVLRQGWSLVIPGLIADSTPGLVEPTSPLDIGRDTATGDVVIGSWSVIEGDNFWKISETVLTEAWGHAPTEDETRPYWSAMVEANREHLESEGADPDMIFVDQQFEVLLPTIPTSATSLDDLAGTSSLEGLAQFTPATSTPEPAAPVVMPDLSGLDLDAEAEPSVPVVEVVAEPVIEDRAVPAASDVESTTETLPVAQEAPVEVVAEADPETPEKASESTLDAQTVGLGALGTAIGGGALLFLLRRLRRFQGARRRPDTAIEPATDDAVAFEARIRPVADVEAVRFLVATNQFLSHKLSESPEAQMPAVIAVRAGVHGVELLLDEECAPVDGFVAAADRAWRLDPGLEVRQLEHEAAHAHPYCPALLPVGETDVGDLLLDFEQMDTIAVSGDSETILGWMRSLAIGVTSTAWSQDCEVVAIGVDDALDGIEQVCVPAEPQAWAEHTATIMRATAKRLAMSTYEARVNSGEIHHPMIVLVGPGYEGVAQFLAEVSSLAYSPLALIAAAPIADAARLELLAESGTLEPSGLDFKPTVTAPEAVRYTTELLAAASQSITIPTDQLLDEPFPSTTELLPESAPSTNTEPVANQPAVDPAGAAKEWHVERPPLPDEPSPEDEYYGVPMDVVDFEPSLSADIDLTDPIPDVDGAEIQEGATAQSANNDDDDDEPPRGPRGTKPTVTTHSAENGSNGSQATSQDPVEASASGQVPVSGAQEPSTEITAKILALTAPSPVEVRVLCDKPEVSGLDEQPTAKMEAVVCYLAYHRSVLSDRVRSEFWPSSVNRSTSDNAIAKIRRRLGTGSDGEARLSLARNTGRYEISDEVGCDWDRFKKLTVLAAATTTAGDQMAVLEAALQLVTGQPTADAPSKYYGWLSDDHNEYGEIARSISDAAHRLGDLALADDVQDAELAHWAAERGLLAQPDHEAMRRIQMRAAFLLGDGKGVEDAYRRAAAVAETHSAFEEVQPETEELYATLTRRQSVGNSAPEQAQN